MINNKKKNCIDRHIEFNTNENEPVRDRLTVFTVACTVQLS